MLPSELKKQTWLNVLLLGIITAGIYYPFWFRKVKRATDQIPDVKQLNDKWITWLLWATILSIPLNITFTTTVNGEATVFTTNFFGIGTLLSFARWVLTILLSFSVQKMLVQLFKTKVSEIWTFFLGPIYLQHKIHTTAETTTQPVTPPAPAPAPTEQ